MTKRQAIRLFGSKLQDLADAVGVTKQAVSLWPDKLNQTQEDRVIGAAYRLGILPRKQATEVEK